MVWRCECRFLAATIVAASLLVEVRGQVEGVVPPGTPGTEEANQQVQHAESSSGLQSCSCSCCQVTSRAETQQVGGATLACAAMDVSSDGDNAANGCPVQCANLPAEHAVVTSAGGTLETARFCQMNCLPEEEKVGGQCRVLTPQETEEALTSGGNGQDIAGLATPATTTPPVELEDPDAPPEPPQLVDQQALNAAADSGAGSGAGGAGGGAGGGGDKKDKDSGALVAQASGKQAEAASIEARLTEAEASSAQSVSLGNTDLESAKNNGMMVIAAKAQVQAAEVQAKIYAASAQKAAEKAKVEMAEIEQIPQKAAEYAAAEAKKEVQAEVNEAASNVAIVKARLAGPGLPVPLAEAAVNAAKPYYAVMNKAIAMGNLYAANAHKENDEANTMQQQSRDLASQAVLYQSAGYPDMANGLMAQAKSLLNQAVVKDEQAKKDMAVAEGVRKNVPNYQTNAAAASARATSIANPAGQPPPAVAPGLVQLSSRSELRTPRFLH